MTDKIHPDVIAFAGTLLELEQLREAHGSNFWAEKIKKSRIAAENSDGWSVDHVLGLYGGIGSLNDLILETTKFENNKLQRLTSEVWHLAKQLSI